MNPLRSVMVFDTTIDAEAIAASCKAWGVDTPCLHPGFLADERLTRALDHHGLRSWLNIPVFCDPKYLEAHPEAYAITSLGRPAVHDWLHFVCPSRDDYLEAAVRVLRRQLASLSPAVVSLDFIRHFLYWEGVALEGGAASIEDGCYCPTCLSRFERACGELVDREAAPEHIHRQLLKPWSEWKCQRILEVAQLFVAELRQLAHGAAIALQTLPWRATDLDGAILSRAGQDVPALARHADLVAPMAFTQMLGQTPRWKRELLAHVQASTAKPVCFYVQADSVQHAGSITPAEFDAELRQAHDAEPAAIVVLQYEQLARRPEQASVLQKHFRR